MLKVPRLASRLSWGPSSPRMTIYSFQYPLLHSCSPHNGGSCPLSELRGVWGLQGEADAYCLDRRGSGFKAWASIKGNFGGRRWHESVGRIGKTSPLDSDPPAFSGLPKSNARGDPCSFSVALHSPEGRQPQGSGHLLWYLQQVDEASRTSYSCGCNLRGTDSHSSVNLGVVKWSGITWWLTSLWCLCLPKRARFAPKHSSPLTSPPLECSKGSVASRFQQLSHLESTPFGGSKYMYAFCVFWDKSSSSLHWLQTCCVAKDDLDLLNLLSIPPEFCNSIPVMWCWAWNPGLRACWKSTLSSEL